MTSPCPICGKETDLGGGPQKNPYRPFCSERCRWVDLGRWLEGTYRLEANDDSQVSLPFLEESSEEGRNSVDCSDQV